MLEAQLRVDNCSTYLRIFRSLRRLWISCDFLKKKKKIIPCVNTMCHGVEIGELCWRNLEGSRTKCDVKGTKMHNLSNSTRERQSTLHLKQMVAVSNLNNNKKQPCRY